jgi:hypothetical protein
MNFEERVNFYLSDKLINSKNINIKDYKYIYTLDDLINIKNKNNFYSVYEKPFINLLIKTNNTKKTFGFTSCDIITKDQQNMVTLCKNRCENNNDSVLLRCLNFERHWYLYYNKPKDIPFENKINKIFWRGTTTGSSEHHLAEKWNPRTVNRFNLIEKWFNKNNKIDIGFSFIHREWLKEKYNKYVKGKCSPEYFLKYKYIISVEGNDKDSGINWKLNSNSLVLMPKPRVTSWLMETTLIPDFHYILLKDDFNDLEEKFNWCNNNENKCKEIIKNANNFMKQFSDNKMEEKLEEAVINKYFTILEQ